MDTMLLARTVLLDDYREVGPVDECDIRDFLRLLLRNHGDTAMFVSEAIGEMNDAKLVTLCEDAIDLRASLLPALAVRAYARSILEKEAAEQCVDGSADPFDEPAHDTRARAIDVNTELNRLFGDLGRL